MKNLNKKFEEILSGNSNDISVIKFFNDESNYEDIIKELEIKSPEYAISIIIKIFDPCYDIIFDETARIEKLIDKYSEYLNEDGWRKISGYFWSDKFIKKYIDKIDPCMYSNNCMPEVFLNYPEKIAKIIECMIIKENDGIDINESDIIDIIFKLPYDSVKYSIEYLKNRGIEKYYSYFYFNLFDKYGAEVINIKIKDSIKEDFKIPKSDYEYLEDYTIEELEDILNKYDRDINKMIMHVANLKSIPDEFIEKYQDKIDSSGWSSLTTDCNISENIARKFEKYINKKYLSSDKLSVDYILDNLNELNMYILTRFGNKIDYIYKDKRIYTKFLLDCISENSIGVKKVLKNYEIPIYFIKEVLVNIKEQDLANMYNNADLKMVNFTIHKDDSIIYEDLYDILEYIFNRFEFNDLEILINESVILKNKD